MHTEKKYIIAPSILSANLAALGEDVQNVISAGADVIHVDVMDNHYVPNLTFGPALCKSLRDYGVSAPIDVHLMVEPVDDLITSFAEAGANMISFHPEASKHVERSISLIKSHKCKPGLALNPATSLECLQYVLKQLDFVLIMTVNPGFGGQKLIPSVLKKISDLKNMIIANNYHTTIAVDGGVTVENIAELAKLGADMFVAGSSIFRAGDYRTAIESMRAQLTKN